MSLVEHTKVEICKLSFIGVNPSTRVLMAFPLWLKDLTPPFPVYSASSLVEARERYRVASVASIFRVSGCV